MTAPKSSNMDGNSFEAWLFRVDCAIRELGMAAYLDRGETMVAMFNTNHDPKTAARCWLRAKLHEAP